MPPPSPPPPLPDADPVPGHPGPLVVGPIAGGDDVHALCQRLRAAIAACEAPEIACDVDALPATLCAIEALARLQLTARRLDRRIRLQRASPALQQLLAFTGFADWVQPS